MSVTADPRLLLNFCCWVVLWAVLCVPLAHAQTGRCGNTFACISPNLFQQCFTPNGRIIPGSQHYDCRLFPNATGTICNENVDAFPPCEADSSPECTSAGAFPFPGDNTRYYVCIFTGRAYHKYFTNCISGYVYEPDERTCRRSVTCVGAGVLPDPTSCSHYLLCPRVQEQATRFACPSGLRYDPVTQSCQLRVMCNGRPL